MMTPHALCTHASQFNIPEADLCMRKQAITMLILFSLFTARGVPPIEAEYTSVLMQAAMNTLDGILDTVSAPHEISALLPLLKINGKLILLGVPTEPHTFSAGSILFKR